MTVPITQSIGLLPAAPNPATDTPTEFSNKAAAFVAAQQLMPPEINTWRTQANALAEEVNDLAVAAEEAADLAVPAAATAVAAKDISVALKPVQSPTPPSSPIEGSQWVNTDTGRHYIWYVDSSGGQWVEIGGLVVDNATAVTEFRDEIEALGAPFSCPELSYSKKLRVVAGTMTNPAGTWSFISDSQHVPVGSASVSVSGDMLVTNYGFTASRVVSVVGVTDETLAAKGLTLGPSVGLSLSNWKLYKPLSCWISKGASLWAFEDIDSWFGSGTDTTITTSADGSSFTITHKAGEVVDVPVATMFCSSGSQATGSDIRLTYGATSITGTAFEDFAGYISFNGTTWVVDTPNIAKPTMSFSAGVLTVTHEDLGADTRGLALTPVGGVLVPSSGSSISATQFQVVFNAFGGAAQSTANTDMRVRYHRPRKVVTKAPTGMRLAVRRGPVLLNPARVISAGGNIWFMGILETD